MEDLWKSLIGAGPSVVRFAIATAVSTVAAGIIYDRVIRGENGPPIRDVAPMLVVVGLIGGAVISRFLRPDAGK